jgi:quinoprotein relay system zinc metallohydrolase 2
MANRLVHAAGWLLAAAAASAAAQPLAVEHVAPGVYVHYGQQAEIAPANGGDIANLGFVVGSRCIAVIDTGGSAAVGRALRAAIRAVSPLPVCYVINTHGHPDHVFGNAAFADDRPEFVGHARLAEALRRRAPNYLNALQRTLGGAASGTTIVAPTRAVAQEMRLDLGARTLQLRAWPTAHTDADLTVFDETSGTLWLGDLLFVGHLPVVDGSVRGYLAALAQLRALPATRVVPGHGRAAAWPQALDAQQRYLQRLTDAVRGALKEQLTLAQTMDKLGRGDDARWGDWLLFDAFHRRNISAAYAELEWE